jgi:hypothetical protein
MALVYLCHKATEGWDRQSYWLAIESLLWWMLVSKFIKLLGHYIRHPVDIFLLPISILFGYFHGVIKMYAVLTLNVVSFAKIPKTKQSPQFFALLGSFRVGNCRGSRWRLQGKNGRANGQGRPNTDHPPRPHMIKELNNYF